MEWNHGVDMLKGFITGIAVTAVATVVGGYIVLQTGLIPANADATRCQVETWIASTSLDATLNREAPKGLNPVSMTDTNATEQQKAAYHRRLLREAFIQNLLNWRLMALKTIPRAYRSGRSNTAYAGRVCPRGRIHLPISRFGHSRYF
jgi:hypothetical protein